MGAHYLPLRDDALLVWATSFSAQIGAIGTAVGLTATQVGNYGDAKDLYAQSLELVQSGATRSPSNISAKNQKKRDLIEMTRELVRIIQAFPATTDQQRLDLGINVRKTPTPQNPPEYAPRASVLGVSGRTFTVAADDPSAETKRKRLAGTVGAWWYSYVGTEYPADPGLWEFCGQSNRYSHEITMPLSMAPGTQVWFTATWIDRKGQTGPMALPVSANVEYSGATSAEKMKIAA